MTTVQLINLMTSFVSVLNVSMESIVERYNKWKDEYQQLHNPVSELQVTFQSPRLRLQSIISMHSYCFSLYVFEYHLRMLGM